MTHADFVVTDIGELATLAVGSVPRIGSAMHELGRIPRAALAVDQGRFVYAGPEARLKREVRLRSTGSTWSAGGGTVVPGFVDPHTHVLFAGDRAAEIDLKIGGASYLDIARRGGGLFQTVRATRRASTSLLLRSAEARLRRMAAMGTTACEVKSGYALTPSGERRLLSLVPTLARRTGLRLVPTFLGAHAVPPEYTDRTDAYVSALITDTLPIVARRRLADFCDAFCEPGFFTVEQTERLLLAARALGLGLKVHADEFVRSGGAELAARLGCRSAEHLIESSERDRRALASAGVTAVLLPVTPFASFARRSSPGREMVDAGVPVAVGTDLSPNSWVESMPLVLSHSVYGAHLTPAEALTAATVNSANAIGISGEAGMIAIGRCADFVAFAVPSIEQIPYRFGLTPERVYRRGLRVPPAGDPGS
ncbi:MAG: imidazolonepropionase [Thermoplasmata archaeon]|nr:imidazolonepropionase [Thermoplasmata archaeon]